MTTAGRRAAIRMKASHATLLFVLAWTAAPALPAAATLLPRLPAILLEGRPFHLRCEHRENPLGLDCAAPRFAWWVGDDQPGAMQSAYQILVASSLEKLHATPDIWDSGKVASDQSIEVRYAGPALVSARRYYWKVRTWDANGRPSEWSESQWWETGLLTPRDWVAQWIGAPARNTAQSAPAVYLRKQFVLKPNIRNVRLYVSARGIFEMRLNGERVGEDFFAPGWTDYRKRNQYLVYDLTSKVIYGVNVIGAILGDGWHNGHLLLIGGGKRNWYGEDTSLLAQLVVTYADGSSEIVPSDASWQTSTGPILAADLYNGEHYDARKELEVGGLTWDAQGYNASKWAAARAVPPPAQAPVAKVNLPIRKQETLRAHSVRQAADGEWIFDFGQNLSGWAKIRMHGPAGTTVTLRFAEMLEPDGTLHRGNLRSAEATDRYVFRGGGPEVWEPHFTSHGFRYVGVRGLDRAPELHEVEAVVLHNDLKATGYFETSDPRVNRLQANIRWSQRANAFDVPTDCPQRDERLGWTGDASFFLPTATFNYDVTAFIEKWMTDLRDAQGNDGRFTVYAPAPDGVNDAPAYSDAGVLCPWIIYQRYGDVGILADNYPAMQAWIEYQRRTSADLLRPAQGYGDWLAPQGSPATPKDLIATAYFFRGTEFMSRVADVLGKTEDARRYRELGDRIGAAFRAKYVRPDGTLTADTATAQALALMFDLLPPPARDQTMTRLIGRLRAGDWKMQTGFVGTPVLMRALKKFHQDDAGLRLLLQRGYPGWLYMVDQGATTIWERWNSWTPETGFGDKIADTGVGDVKMNSFNHTVWGSVGEWMYATIGGIDSDPAGPGFKRFRVRPFPGGGLTWARAALDSPHGRIATEWKVAGAEFTLEVDVPPNTRARVEMPDGKATEVGAGRHTLTARLP